MVIRKLLTSLTFTCMVFLFPFCLLQRKPKEKVPFCRTTNILFIRVMILK